ncbi:single-stranded DNA-binding protein [Blautia coccoides]|uniref:single-stranded DNA-binding protein n=1 Tax=Blautia producta TaxID=33035 RepID=UPI002149A0B4|nr:single-stranded DNA-binding protein [Blautia coccoides]
MNVAALTGRMTRDPELRRTAQGDAVTSFTIAVDRDYTGKNGQKEADFINCVIWRKPAENVEKYCSKGSLVSVEGKIHTRHYDNAQGQRVNVVEVVCSNVQFLETKSAREKRPAQQAVQQSFQQPYQSQAVDLEKEFDNSMNSFDIAEDDIQF